MPDETGEFNFVCGMNVRRGNQFAAPHIRSKIMLA